MTPPPQTIGRYQVERLIGRGGMATLYLATDPTLGRQVAIKVLREPDSQDLRERFLREARTVASLSHQNIVNIFELGEFAGGWFIVMEYLPGETLAELIHRRTRLSIARKLEIVREVCAGLGHAHAKGVVHRDVKPANVIVTDWGAVKVLDFGIARMVDSGPIEAGMMIGSLSYLSPEQADGRPVDVRSDIFGVGVLLYELLSSRMAFPGADESAIVAAIIRSDPTPIESLVPGLHRDIASIVSRAMAHDPAARYQDIGDMAADLERVRCTTPEALACEPLPPEGAAAAIPVTRVIPRAAMPVTAADVSAAPTNLDAGGRTVILTPAAAAALLGDRPLDVQLVVVRSADVRRRGRTVPVTVPRFRVGRGPECELQLDDASLSHEHLTIEYGPRGFFVRDATSTNGTFLNGRRLRSGGTEPLYFGATIEAGDTALGFALAADVKVPDLAGRRLADRYDLVRLIRDSAKGAVYAGRDSHIGRDVAVKFISPELMRFEGYREQFEQEAAIGATLHHPHICQVIDRGEDEIGLAAGGTIRLSYLCFELMGGGSLQRRLRSGPLALDAVTSCVEKIANALDFAHRQGVVHGNVKPSAIVFSTDDHVYLTDFAYAHGVLHTPDGPVLGAPAFVAPEVWDHGPSTAASDQYALGVVAYYAIAGSLPFVGQENPDVRRRNFRSGAAPVHHEAIAYRQERVPRGVSAVLTRAMAQEPDRRFTTAGEFAKALTSALQGHHSDQDAVRIFLSYQRDISSGWANYFARELKDHGIVTFLDVQQLDRAQQFPARLQRAIEECDVFVCLLGATTLQSAWVLQEIRQAHRAERPMIPIFQESFDLTVARSLGDAAVEVLLSHDAVYLFDIRNVHVQHSAMDLASRVKNTVS